MNGCFVLSHVEATRSRIFKYVAPVMSSFSFSGGTRFATSVPQAPWECRNQRLRLSRLMKNRGRIQYSPVVSFCPKPRWPSVASKATVKSARLSGESLSASAIPALKTRQRFSISCVRVSLSKALNAAARLLIPGTPLKVTGRVAAISNSCANASRTTTRFSSVIPRVKRPNTVNGSTSSGVLVRSIVGKGISARAYACDRCLSSACRFFAYPSRMSASFS